MTESAQTGDPASFADAAPADVELQPAVATELAALADLLAEQPDYVWNDPSLCEGWRIREVIAHMTMAARYTPEHFGQLMQDYQGEFDRLSYAVAITDAQRAVTALIADLRCDTMAHWAPPGGGYSGALNHAVVHTLDVTVPLGVPHPGPEENLQTILDGLTSGGVHHHFGMVIDGRRLVATDAEWSFGEGDPLEATREDLILLLCGRPVPQDRFTGEPLERAEPVAT